MNNSEYIKIYANFLKQFIRLKRSLKVIFDCSNGTAGPILQKLKVKSLKFKIINGRPNGNFPAHGPDPLKPNAAKQLQAEVKKQKADLGAIFDADGDRVFFVDNLGRFINPDIVGWLLIWHLRPEKTVIDVRTGWLIKRLKIENCLSLRGLPLGEKLKIFESRVGHYFIKNLMRKNRAELGMEWTGHYYFKDFFYTDSGILTAIEIINAVSRLPYNLSDFIELLPAYYRSGELNFPVKNKEKLLTVIRKTYKNKAVKISSLDGLTMEFKDWWFNIRPSNTEPLIRLNIETTSKKLLNQKIKEFQKLLRIT